MASRWPAYQLIPSVLFKAEGLPTALTQMFSAVDKAYLLLACLPVGQFEPGSDPLLREAAASKH